MVCELIRSLESDLFRRLCLKQLDSHARRPKSGASVETSVLSARVCGLLGFRMKNNKTVYEGSFVKDNAPSQSDLPVFTGQETCDIPSIANCAVELLAASLGEEQHSIAVATDGRSWTYSELAAGCERFANLLTDQYRAGPGSRILLLAENSFSTIVAWLAIIRIGGIVVLVPASGTEKEISGCASQAAVQLLVCGEGHPQFPVSGEFGEQGVPVCRLSDSYGSSASSPVEEKVASEQGLQKPQQTSADDYCLILFSSASLGKPKATLHT